MDVDGPYDRDDQESIFIPEQYQIDPAKFYPYQKKIYDSREIQDNYFINYLYCPNGNIGKTTIACHMDCKKMAYVIPPLNNGYKMTQFFCSFLSNRKDRDPKLVFVDIPRSMNQNKVSGFYTAIESIKKGLVFDTRYGGKKWHYKPPQVWVFSHKKPNLRALSRQRWKIWMVNEQKEFEAIDPESLFRKRSEPEPKPKPKPEPELLT